MEYVDTFIRDVEAIAALRPELVLPKLRELPLDDFGLLLLDMPDTRYPNLSAVLPRMADPQVQRNWTGSDSVTLLRQSLNFIRILSHGYTDLTGVSLRQKRVLDFGVGWGRLIRLMYHFSDADKLYGCDPWDISLKICRDDRLQCHLALSEYIPTSLPFEGKFDLIYAFSVFTHLSERATRAALSTLSRSVSDSGILAVTIRPVEYWRHHDTTDRQRQSMMAEHRSRGFSFLPHNRVKIDGDITYGDTSMTIEWLASHVPDLRIRKIERSIDDPFQLVVLLSH